MLVDRDDHPELLPEAHYDAHIVDIVKRDNPDPLRALLSAGISQNPCFSIGESIASLACRFGSVEILKVLVDAGCDPNATDQYGRTCLHEACRAMEPNWVIVTLLLDRHVGLLFTKDAYGMSPLMYVKPVHSDVWIEFLNSKATVYFPRKSGCNAQALAARVSSGSAMVSTLANGTYNQERDDNHDGSDSSEVEIEDESSSSNESLSDVLFSAYENEMAELVALMDARMGRKK
jgi:Ankyrin repeats (3 copies)